MQKRLWIGQLLTFVALGAGQIVLSGNMPAGQSDELPAGFLLRRQQDPRAFMFKRAFLELARTTRASRVRLMSRFPAAAEVEAAVSAIAIAGERAIPVLPVKFRNTQLVPFQRNALQDRLFGTGAGTMTSFYKENSYGLLSVSGTVRDWETLPSDDTFYEGPDFTFQGRQATCNGICQGAKLGDLIQQALTSADGTTDFSQFDNDGPDGRPNSGDDDGFVDFVAFVQPETGGECGGANNRNIWSHRWNYATWKGTEFQTNDNAAGGGKIKIDDYVIMPGLDCDGQTMIQIGVFAHEFGHAFGLPDLYDTDPANGVSQGLGLWCLMASGSWGGDGRSPDQPTHMSAWAKTFLGWLQPRPVTTDTPSASLTPVEASRTAALKIPISATQYYLVEYRARQAFDAKLPSAGLLVWKINDTVITAGLANNRVNADALNKGIDLVEADGRNDLDRALTAANPGNRGDAGDPYPGSSGNRRLDATSNPRSNGRVALCAISNPGIAMTLQVLMTRNACQ